jgi:hypothetical protein
VAILETTIFLLQLLAHLLIVAHFLLIWSLYGTQFTLIGGILALHLHSAIFSASKKIGNAAICITLLVIWMVCLKMRRNWNFARQWCRVMFPVIV